MTLSGSVMTPYLTDMITILQRTIVDPYPEVKKVGGVFIYGEGVVLVDSHVLPRVLPETR